MSPIQSAVNQWRRAGLYLFAASFLIGAALWVRLVDDEPFMPLAWPALWILAGVSVAAFATWPRSERLYRLAGATAFGAYVARPIGTLARWYDGDVLGARLGLSLIAFTTLAVCIAIIWVTEVAEWHVRHQAGVTARGD
jgi:hypothetical protein